MKGVLKCVGKYLMLTASEVIIVITVCILLTVTPGCEAVSDCSVITTPDQRSIHLNFNFGGL